MSTVFMTGGAGLIGSHATRVLLDRGLRVVAYDSFAQYVSPPKSTFFENLQYRLANLLPGAELIHGDTRGKDQLRRELLRINPEYVVHLAALPLAGRAVQVPEEAFGSILQGTANVLDVVRDISNLKKFVFVSSSMAYGNFPTTPLPEASNKDPIDLYGAMKLSGELLVRAYGRQYGLPYVIVRPSAVYGPSDNNYRVVQILIERALQGRPITVEDPETTYLDFTYVSDFAKGLSLATLAPGVTAEDFNLTYGSGRSLSELTAILRQHFPDIEVTVRAKSESYRPVRGTLDISKARQLLGYQPKVPLEEGVARYLDYIRATNASIVKDSPPMVEARD